MSFKDLEKRVKRLERRADRTTERFVRYSKAVKGIVDKLVADNDAVKKALEELTAEPEEDQEEEEEK